MNYTYNCCLCGKHIDSGDYDDYDKNEVWEFTKDYLDLSHADIQQEIKAFELTK